MFRSEYEILGKGGNARKGEERGRGKRGGRGFGK